MAGGARHCRLYGGQGRKRARLGPPRQAPSRRSRGPCLRRTTGTLVSVTSQKTAPLGHAMAFPTFPGLGGDTQGFVGGEECWAPPQVTDQTGPPGTGSNRRLAASSVPLQWLQVRAGTSHTEHQPPRPGLAQSWLNVTLEDGTGQTHCAHPLCTREPSTPRWAAGKVAATSGDSGCAEPIRAPGHGFQTILAKAPWGESERVK